MALLLDKLMQVVLKRKLAVLEDTEVAGMTIQVACTRVIRRVVVSWSSHTAAASVAGRKAVVRSTATVVAVGR